MRLRGLGVIGEAVLEFGPGLTVVTGETGTGKTMVVTGLGLLFGGRADPGAVRTGEASALVEGRILVEATGTIAERVREAGGELDDLVDGTAELIVSRTVGAEGRSRSHVGGRAAPVALISELAEDLIAVHLATHSSTSRHKMRVGFATGPAAFRAYTSARRRKLASTRAASPIRSPRDLRRAYQERPPRPRPARAGPETARRRSPDRRRTAAPSCSPRGRRAARHSRRVLAPL